MSKIILGITGLAGAGKSTAAKILRDEMGFTIAPFAAPMKDIARDFGLSESDIGTGKESPLPPGALPEELSGRLAVRAVTRIVPFGWTFGGGMAEPRPDLGEKTIAETADNLATWFAASRTEFTTPRRFLQMLGTEWGRDRIHSEMIAVLRTKSPQSERKAESWCASSAMARARPAARLMPARPASCRTSPSATMARPRFFGLAFSVFSIATLPPRPSDFQPRPFW
jgi:hypothetical protein